MTIWMPVEPEANELLSRSPLALLIAMLLDQQVPLERAFSAPLDLVRRLGHEPTVAELAEFDPDALAAIFSERPALHRYPRAMAARIQDLARLIMERYDGDAAQVWESAGSGAELLRQVAALPRLPQVPDAHREHAVVRAREKEGHRNLLQAQQRRAEQQGCGDEERGACPGYEARALRGQ